MKKNNRKEELLRALHEGLGGDGWANSSRSYDEMTYKRKDLEKALGKILTLVQKYQKKDDQV